MTRSDRKLRLDDQLCFALYAATNAITRAYRPLLDEIGLTYPQYLVMLVLWQDGASSIGHIAERLSLAPNAITPLLDRLEANGFVARRRDDHDRRVIHVALTAAGAELEKAAAAAQHVIACQTQLGTEEFHDFRVELMALARRLEREEIHAPEERQTALETDTNRGNA